MGGQQATRLAREARRIAPVQERQRPEGHLRVARRECAARYIGPDELYVRNASAVGGEEPHVHFHDRLGIAAQIGNESGEEHLVADALLVPHRDTRALTRGGNEGRQRRAPAPPLPRAPAPAAPADPPPPPRTVHSPRGADP